MGIKLYPPNAILFVLDLGNDSIEVPEYSPGELITNSGSCISISTRAEVDGDVTVRLSDRSYPSEKSGCKEVFSESIATPGKNVAVVTSHMTKVLDAKVKRTITQIAIGVDDLEFPSLVWIEVVD